MSELLRTQIENALRGYLDPHLQQDLVTTKAVQAITVTDTVTEKQALIEIGLAYPARGYSEQLSAELRAYLQQQIPELQEIKVKVSWQVLAHAVQGGLKPHPQIKNMIAVASGKGGVGKSTTAVNLALALAAEGAQVGILDADIYGPNQPQLLGSHERPRAHEDKTIEPIVRHGLQSMSIGYLVDIDTPMVWRGPMATTALQQLLNDTRWQGLDYLIIDLPPGTGDIQLTLAQKIPVSAAVIVTTPQDIALLDARKGIAMFQKVNVPVLGVIENMSVHVCSQCGHAEHIFGQGGGERLAKQYGVELLGCLPLDIRIREQADAGKPTVAADPESLLSLGYRAVARRVAAKLSLQAKNYTRKFPNIVVENR